MAKLRKTAALGKLIAPAVTIMLIAAPLTVGAALVKDRIDQATAAIPAKQRFLEIRAAIAARLHQPEPIQFGAVWATHSGRICGLVNGEGSFGGLTGMVPFFADGPRVLYSIETDAVLFSRGWLECGKDMWVEILPGSTQSGYCATREGASRCFWTSRRQPDEPD